MFTALLYAALAAGDSAPDAALAGETPTAEQVRFFETSVRPVLVEHCQKCHGEKQQWSSLRLDSREAILKGGDTGAAVIPGKPDESLLIRAIRHEDENLKMPEEGKLSDRQIADLVRWVEMGAPYAEAPKDAGPRKRDPGHWSFQPIQNPALPEVQHQEWVANEIDRFVLAKIEAAGLEPNGLADKATLIRRVTFDLTGLPPTPSEVAEFLADERADAYIKLVDRLLESPAYGEKWGRHWLDVARYADSNGLDENIAHGNAWRYRDYVVASFNQDKPFDRFVVEQLAGDLLPASDEATKHEQLVATGFLSIGAKVLAEPDHTKMRMDIVDEQIDTIGRAFLGMTLGCARCHDHKFDPIDTADYYGLAGIFKSTRTMDSYVKISKWHEHELPTPEAVAAKAEYDANVAAKKQAIETFVAAADKQIRESQPAGAALPEKLETLYSEETKAQLTTLRDELAALEKTPFEMPSTMGVTEDAIVDVQVHVRGNPQKLGDMVPRRALPVVHGPAAPQFSTTSSGRKELAEWLVDPSHPLTARVMVNRVWRWHFGAGIVRSTENFGLLGEAPSHPELLDWLATRFVQEGWSIKSLHRLMLTSSAYRQESKASEAALAADPENRLLSRAHVRRLEAEEVRDALLAVSGRLDASMGGSLLKVPNRGFLFDHTSIDLTDYSSVRRSLYLPVIRNNVYPVFRLLDFPDPAVPSGDRATTTVAPQALLMLNSELVIESAEALGRRVLAEAADDRARIARLYSLAYGREAEESEIADDTAFVNQVEQSLVESQPDADARQRDAWSVLCHVVLAANEFIYVR